MNSKGLTWLRNVISKIVNYLNATLNTLLCHSLTKDEKSLLSRGLNFAILPKIVNYADYVLPFELLFRDINLCETPSYDKEFICGRSRDCAFTTFRDSSKINENNYLKKNVWL